MLTSCTITCTERSKPHSPTRLSIVPPTRLKAAQMGDSTVQKADMAAARQHICQLTNQMPLRMGPIRPITAGAIHVAEISKPTDTVRAMLIYIEL